ncbi:hypothetical protein SAICODRAFT_19536 [Saitoella complicata NRRL Y-17804]|nr:uncharacterized protein SAICODRAFT_19536 [Saitoella complicata NRRL Y-17804]ODQ52739.1 hypothetical protein SAICODRAFT_19536 [Saitoella complicata NRRL Y-17804]
MPGLSLDRPLETAESVTRHLRDRSVPIEDQLVYANRLFTNDINVFLPRKEEFLLEWIFDRLCEDGVGGKSFSASKSGKKARLLEESWVFVADVFQHEMVSDSARVIVFRKAPFIAFISSVLNELTTLTFEEVAKLCPVLQRALSILYGGASPVTSRSGIDSGITLYANLLSLCAKYPDSEAVDVLGDEVESLFRTSLYGQANQKKIFQSFSQKCLLPSLALLGNPTLTSWKRSTLSNAISSHIFAPEALYDFSAADTSKPTAGFGAVTSLITSATSGRSEILAAIPDLLNIALQSLRKDTGLSTRQISLSATKISDLAYHIFASLISTAEALRGDDIQVWTAVLDLLRRFSAQEGQGGAGIGDERLTIRLSEIVKQTLQLLGTGDDELKVIAYRVTSAVLDLDFDTVLDSAEQLYPLLAAPASPTVTEAALSTISDLIKAHTTARDLGGFATAWEEALRQNGMDGPLGTQEAIEAFAKAVAGRGMSAGQIKALIEELTDKLAEGRGVKSVGSPDRSKRRRVSGVEGSANDAAFVPLLAVLSGVRSDEIAARILPTLKDLYERVLSVNWGVWTAKVHYVACDVSEAYLLSTVSTDVTNAMRECMNQGTECLFWALQVLFKYRESVELIEDASVRGSVEEAFQFAMIQVADIIEKGKSDEHWDGKLKTLSKDNLPVAIVSLLTGRWLTVVNAALPKSKQENLFRQIRALIRESIVADQATLTGSYATLEKSMLGSAIFFEQEAVKDVYVDEVLRDLSLGGKFNTDVESIRTACTSGSSVELDRSLLATALSAIHSLALFPLECLKRGPRARALDLLLQVDACCLCNSSSEPVAYACVRDGRQLMLRLFEVPNMSSFLATESASLSYLFLSLDAITSEDVVKCTQSIGRTMIGQIAAEKSLEKGKDFVRVLLVDAEDKTYMYGANVTSRFSEWLDQVETKTKFTLDGWVVMAETLTLAFQAEDNSGFLDASAVDNIKTIASGLLSLLGSLLEKLTLVEDQTRAVEKLAGSADLLRCFTELVLNVNNVKAIYDYEALTKALLSLAGRTLNVVEGTREPQTDILRLACMLSHNAASAAAVMSFYIVLAPQADLSRNLQRMSEHLTVQDLAAVTSELASTCWSGDVAIEQRRAALAALRSFCHSFKQDVEAAPSSVLPNVVSGFCKNVVEAGHAGLFVDAVRLLETVVREKAWAVSQYNLDQILSTVTLCASPAGPEFEKSDKTPDEIFMALTNVMSCVLQHHRHRLSGRYHVIVGAFQALLHAFVRRQAVHRRGRTADGVARQPKWLVHHSEACSVFSARAYARLLSTWVDPTAAQLRQDTRVKNIRHHLTSASASASKAVAKHIAWLFVEFVSVQLHHPHITIASDVRDVLMSGMYSLFDICGQHEREMVAAALDASGRGIFQKMYEDWKRFGQWVEK